MPYDIITYNCGAWSVTSSDTGEQATGIYDITLAENYSPDSSFNVQFNPDTLFTDYGITSVSYSVEVLDLAQPAQAALHVRTRVGNEFDSILTYAPVKINVAPDTLNIGAWRYGTSDDSFLVITNTDMSSCRSLQRAIEQSVGVVNHSADSIVSE